MKLISGREAAYLLKHLRQVKHTTLNPYGPGVIRIYLVPPKFTFDKEVPAVAILNGQDILPVNLSWAILLSAFMDELSLFDGKEIGDTQWEGIFADTIKTVRKIYTVPEKTLKDDLWQMLNTFASLAKGEKPPVEIGQISIGEYAKYMTAPHRMDLMISSMQKKDGWNCNQKCVHCYAAGQELAHSEELTTKQWKKIIDKCKASGIPQLTFTGGEPTLREDLTELIDYSKWFITRLNTNGVLLTKELCKKLYEASLDSLQVTLYSADREIHNALVGAENWDKTVDGIKNALDAGINVSINTPLCTVNSSFANTLKLLHKLGIIYVSCSGLIPAGNAAEQKSQNMKLSPDELSDILTEAVRYCNENGMEISFTSPGWLPEQKLREIGILSVPTCGACLSNMAVSPNGYVIPCQSWLGSPPLGNMLSDPWKKIWNAAECRKIREKSAKMEQLCQLKSLGREKTL